MQISNKEKNSGAKEENSVSKRPLDFFYALQKRKGLVFVNREIVGVDIGKSSIKVVQVDITKTPPVIKGVYVEEIPIDKRDRAEVTDAYIIGKLKSIVSKAHLKNSLAVSFVSGSSVYNHSCTLAEMPPAELEEAIKTEVGKEIPFSIDESFFGYNIAGKTSGKKGQELDIAAVFAHRDIVNKKIWLLEQSGLQPAGLTVLPFAYENIFSGNIDETPENVVIITLGEDTTGIDFFRNGNFLFTREVNVSGKDVNKSLSGMVSAGDKKIEIPAEDGEIFKRSYGVILDPLTVPRDNPANTQLVAASKMVFEKMATEIKRSLGFFMRMAKISKLDAVYICGGGANTRNILEFLKQQLGVTVEYFPYTKYFKLSPAVNEAFQKDSFPLYFVLPACGLALEEKQAKINLVPKSNRLISKIASFKSVYNFTIFFFYLVIIGLFVYIRMFIIPNFESVIGEQDRSFSNITEMNRQVEEFNTYKAKVNRKKKVLETLVGQRPLWHGILKEISRITPESVTLKDIYFTYDPESKDFQVKMTGEVRRDRKNVDYIVSAFTLELKNSLFFKDVNLENTQISGDKTIFSINGRLVY